MVTRVVRLDGRQILDLDDWLVARPADPRRPGQIRSGPSLFPKVQLAEPRGMRPLVAHCHLSLGKVYQGMTRVDFR